MIACGVLLAGCAVPDAPASLSAKTACSVWLSDSMAVRQRFLNGYWPDLSSEHVHKVIEIKDAGCRSAEVDAEPGKEPAVGAFQPLVNEVISGTYGP